jgi:molybdenum cofactor biosynthesis protein B
MRGRDEVVSDARSGAPEHRKIAAERGAVAVAVVTISDSRTPETDDNLHYLKAQLAAAGHRLASYRLVRDEPDQIDGILDELAAGDAQIILMNGGTGVAPRDTTFDVVSRKLEKVLPGFGEIFRMLSYQQVGAAAMLSRATAGIFRQKVVISTPGSPAAVQLAWEKLILPEIQHLAWEVTRTARGTPGSKT